MPSSVSFPSGSWLVAYDLLSKKWSSHPYTPKEEATHDRAFQDLYCVVASDEVSAQKMAQEQRRQETTLTLRQRKLLHSLVTSAMERHAADPLEASVELHHSEYQAGQGLLRRGLLELVDEFVPEYSKTKMVYLKVKLTWAALNGRPRDLVKMQAHHRQKQGVEQAPASPIRRRLRS